MSRIASTAISDKRERDFATNGGDSNCLRCLVDSDEIFGEVSRRQAYRHVFCIQRCTQVAQMLVARGLEAMSMLARRS